MLSYAPGDGVVHRLDPRSKLAFQVAFAVAAAAATTPVRLAAAYVLAGAALAAARCSPVAVARSYRVVLVVLALAPPLAGAAVGPPWFRPEPALESLLAVLRVPPVLAVGAAYLRTTPVRDTRAAVEWTLPGRAGRLVGLGVGLVVRFVPVVTRDLRATRTAMAARGGQRRSVVDRSRRLFLRGLERTFERSDRLALALRARCLSWNPTGPELRFGPADYAVLALATGLVLAALLSSLPLGGA